MAAINTPKQCAGDFNNDQDAMAPFFYKVREVSHMIYLILYSKFSVNGMVE